MCWHKVGTTARVASRNDVGRANAGVAQGQLGFNDGQNDLTHGLSLCSRAMLALTGACNGFANLSGALMEAQNLLQAQLAVGQRGRQ